MLDWTNNDLSTSDTVTQSDFSTAGFTYQQLMLRTNSENQTFLRTASELDELYATSRYSDKWNLEGFSFDYEYDTLPANEDATIPSDLVRIIGEIDPNEDPYFRSRYTCRGKKLPQEKFPIRALNLIKSVAPTFVEKVQELVPSFESNN